jgi:peptidyl-prolyl cis-trans isomerase SurA
LRNACPFRLVGALLAIGALAHGDIIDRIAVSVGNRVITQSDVDRALRVAAFQDGVKADFSAARKQAAAEAMIEQKLIQNELENSRYPLPDSAELTPAIEQFKKQHFKNDQDYQMALAEYGITEEDFKEVLLWQRTLLMFVQVRFESGVQITVQDVLDYFEKTVKPAAEAAKPGQAVSLEDYSDQIEKKLIGQRADQQMDTWLKEARKRTGIIFHDEVLQ